MVFTKFIWGGKALDQPFLKWCVAMLASFPLK